MLLYAIIKPSSIIDLMCVWRCDFSIAAYIWELEKPYRQLDTSALTHNLHTKMCTLIRNTISERLVEIQQFRH